MIMIDGNDFNNSSDTNCGSCGYRSGGSPSIGISNSNSDNNSVGAIIYNTSNHVMVNAVGWE